MKGRLDHIYLTFSQPGERQKLYHKIIVARQQKHRRDKPSYKSSLSLNESQPDHPLSPKPYPEQQQQQLNSRHLPHVQLTRLDPKNFCRLPVGLGSEFGLE